MNISALTSVLLFIFSILCLGTGIYAFRRYSMTQSERLFAVGLAMCITAIGIACGALNGLPFLPPLNLNWAWYIGTFCGFFFLFLSSMMTSAEQFRLLKRWGIIAAAAVVIVIALTPVFPAFTNPFIPLLLNSFRIIACLLCFVRYVMLYTSKGTRFSLLMCLAFLFITVGYGILVPQILEPSLVAFTTIGAFIRIIGAAILFIAFILG